MTPRATALLRMPRAAYSMASAFVAAALAKHLLDGELGDAEEPAQVAAGDRVVVLPRVLGERFGDEDAGVVDEGVDTSEPLDRGGGDALGRGRVGDVALHGHDLRVVGGGDGPGGGDHGVAELAVRLDPTGADALGPTGDDGDLLGWVTPRSPAGPGPVGIDLRTRRGSRVPSAAPPRCGGVFPPPPPGTHRPPPARASPRVGLRCGAATQAAVGRGTGTATRRGDPTDHEDAAVSVVRPRRRSLRCHGGGRRPSAHAAAPSKPGAPGRERPPPRQSRRGSPHAMSLEAVRPGGGPATGPSAPRPPGPGPTRGSAPCTGCGPPPCTASTSRRG